jgi:hypothetical protein
MPGKMIMTTHTSQARPGHRDWQAPGPHLAQLTTYPSRPGLVTSWLHPPPPALPVAIRLTLTLAARSSLQPQACKSTIESESGGPAAAGCQRLQGPGGLWSPKRGPGCRCCGGGTGNPYLIPVGVNDPVSHGSQSPVSIRCPARV